MRHVAERCLVLFKGEHRYIFRVQVGQEERFLASLADLAADERFNFDWQDVAFFRRLVSDLAARRAPGALDGRFERSETHGRNAHQ